MIPDVRLMIVALLASIVAISCGLGLFAAFRVNHDQFARAPNGSPALQLAFVVPASVTDAGVPLAVRLPANMPPPSAAAPVMTPINRDPAASEPVKPVAAAEPATAVPTPSDHAPAPATANDTGQQAPPAIDTESAGDVAAVSPADQTPPPADPAASSVKPEQRAHSAAIRPAAKAKVVKRATRSRVVRLRRRIEPQAATAADPAIQVGAFPQPVFQTTLPAAEPRPVRGRIAVRRRRPNAASAPALVPQQTAVGSSPANPSIR